MKMFGLNQSMTDLWDWLNKGKNYTEFKRAFEEIKKFAAMDKGKVDKLKKIDKFFTEIDELKKAKKEEAEKYKTSIKQVSAPLELCLKSIESVEPEEFEDNPLCWDMKVALDSVGAIGTIK
jgi:hypothetical protein